MNGYPSKQPCVICGAYDENKSEPRFGYTVCREHYDVPPTEVPHA